MKKQFLLITLVLCLGLFTYAQNTGISDVSHTPDASAVLDVYSTSKGMLIPRISDSTAVSNPVDGLCAYFTTTHSFWYYDSQQWRQLVAGETLAGDVRFGSAGNYFYIESDGSFQLEGTATQWDDLRVSLAVTKKGTLSKPHDYLLHGIYYTYAFEDDETEDVIFFVQLPHSYKLRSAIYPHVHWFPTESGTGTVKWGLSYSWANYQSAIPNPTTIYATDNALGQYRHSIAQFPAISGTGKNISSMLCCRLYRNATADTYGHDAGILEFDFHFEINTLGSRQEYVK